MTGTGLDRVGALVLSLVADATARTLVVAAVAGAILTVWRPVSVTRRALMWTAVLYASLALPVLVMVVPARLRVPSASVPMISTALSHITTPAQALRDRAQALFVSSSDGQPSVSPPPVSAVRVRVTWLDVFFLTYLMVAAWLVGRVARAWSFARQFTRGAPIASTDLAQSLEAEAHRLGLRRVPRIVEQPRISVPMTSGIVRPVIALPADWREWPADVMQAVLVHELTHVARRDALTQAVSRVNRALAWINPLSWWLHRQVADLAEQASDEAALDAGVDPARYAETLLMFARRLPAAVQGPAWSVAMARQSGLATERRIDRVLAWTRARTGQRESTMRTLIVVVAGLVVLVTASVRVDAARTVASLALTPLRVSRAAAPTGGLTIVPLAATVDHVSPSIERPLRHAPDVVRDTMPSSPAITLPAQAAVRIASGFGAGAYRPGGGATSPVLVKQADPQYTRDAVNRKLEGDVELDAVVLADGTVGDIRISRSTIAPVVAADRAAGPLKDREWYWGSAAPQQVQTSDPTSGLNEAAVRAARQWTFKPAVLNRVAVPMLVTLQLQFHLATAKLQSDSPTGYYYQQVPQTLTDDFANGAYWIGTTGLTPPVLVAQVEPKYTAQAMRDKIQGDAVVELIVMPDGSVGKTLMAISLDPIDGLDDNALVAAQHYRFMPGLLNGQPVSVLVTISLSFRLH